MLTHTGILTLFCIVDKLLATPVICRDLNQKQKHWNKFGTTILSHNERYQGSHYITAVVLDGLTSGAAVCVLT